MRKSLGCLTLLVVLSSALPAQEVFVTHGLAGLRSNWFLGLVPTGLDYQVALNSELLPGTITSLYLQAGGGYETFVNSRDLATGDPTNNDPLLNANIRDLKYESPNFAWEVLVLQGLVKKNDRENLAQVWAGYRGRYATVDPTGYLGWGDQSSIDLAARAAGKFPDANNLLGTSFVAGISYLGTETRAHDVLDGVSAEWSAEGALGSMNPVGGSSFWRTTGKAVWSLGGFDVDPSAPFNTWSGYAKLRAMLDVAGGDSIPLYVNNSFGGWSLEDTVGDELYGYWGESLSTKVKAVVNTQYRVLGPTLFGLEGLYPVAFAFFDTGYFSGYDRSASKPNAQGLVVTTGAAVGVNLWGVFTACLWGSVPLVHPNAASALVPGWDIMSSWKY